MQITHSPRWFSLSPKNYSFDFQFHIFAHMYTFKIIYSMYLLIQPAKVQFLYGKSSSSFLVTNSLLSTQCFTYSRLKFSPSLQVFMQEILSDGMAFCSLM
jgi:hypothetical protein